MGIKPKLTKQIALADFKNHYWLRTELAKFCKANGLSTVGLKQELVLRIEAFIITGYKIKPKINKPVARDSYQPIKINTFVKNYNNDAVTRQFFVKHIGGHFHFNAYLRQFTNKNNIMPGLTYGDLVKGWLTEESKRANPHYKSSIDKQFEYNQFVREFFANEKGKSHADVIKAWKIVKALYGEKTYAHYKATLSKHSSYEV